MKKIQIPNFYDIYKDSKATPLLQTVVGSYMTGLFDEDSDYDYRAVHVYNKDNYISVRSEIQSVLECKDGKLDGVSSELGAFLGNIDKNSYNAYEIVNSQYTEFYGSNGLKKEFENVCKNCFNPYKLCNSYIGAMASAVAGLNKAFNSKDARKAIKCFFLHHRMLASYYYTLKNREDKLFPTTILAELHKKLGASAPSALPDINTMYAESKKDPDEAIKILCEGLDVINAQMDNAIKNHKPILLEKIEETKKDNTELLNNFYRKAVYEFSNNN